MRLGGERQVSFVLERVQRRVDADLVAEPGVLAPETRPAFVMSPTCLSWLGVNRALPAMRRSWSTCCNRSGGIVRNRADCPSDVRRTSLKLEPTESSVGSPELFRNGRIARDIAGPVGPTGAGRRCRKPRRRKPPTPMTSNKLATRRSSLPREVFAAGCATGADGIVGVAASVSTCGLVIADWPGSFGCPFSSSRSSSAMSSGIVWNRAAGSGWRHLVISASTPGGIAGSIERTGAGGRNMRSISSATAVVACAFRWPSRRSCRMRPNE